MIPPALASIPSFGYLGNHFNLSVGTLPIVFSPPPSPAYVTMPSSSSQGITAQYTNRSKRYLTGGHIAGIVVASALAVIIAIFVFIFFTWKTKEQAAENKHEPSAQDVNRKQDMTTELKHKPVPDVATMRCLMPKEKIVDADFQNKNMVSSIAATAYTIGELQTATNSFNQENLVGEGTSARVYKAKFATGKFLAVKKLDSSILMVHEKDFFEVLTGISRLRHANITELVGYCTDHGHCILVYEYVSNGTLHEALHFGEEKSRRLSWNLRIKIALGAARALEYLHEICQPMVVHRNFKSSNILLDEDFNPHLSDCGLLPLTSFGSQCQFSSQQMGSFGYSAPEFAMSGMYSAKSDVYSFGVLMLELLTGRKPLDSSRCRAEQSLVRWATPQLNDIDSLSKMVDPALKGIYPAKSLSRFADVIAVCVQPEPEFRPPMSEVVQSLVRLLQRASVHKRRSGDDLGFSQRIPERQEPGEA